MNDIIKALQWRYAVKKFDASRQLEAAKVEKLKEAFNLTATSYGLQPIKMIVLQDKNLQEQLVSRSFGQKQVADASHVLILCSMTRLDQHYIADYFKRVKTVRGTADKILQPFEQALQSEFSSKSDSELSEWAGRQAYLALGNLLTVCAAEEIDSCPMEGFDPGGYGELLKLEALNLAPVLVLPVGYRSPEDPFSGFKKVRKELADSIIEMIKN